MSGKYQWRFPKLDGGREQGFNNSGIATFNGTELYDNLAREICQNSLDAKPEDSLKPVKVTFKIKKINKADHNALMQLEDIFRRCRDYWQSRMDDRMVDFFEQAQNIFNEGCISFLIVSDFNTTGLTGVKADKSVKSVWRSLTHSDGVSDKGAGSGGSFGIGKNAPFACSQLRTVFYNTYAADNIKAFQGAVMLVTHTAEDGEDTSGSGIFQNIENKTPVFAGDDCSILNEFSRTEFGTDIIIAGYNQSAKWQEEIEIAVLKNFFSSILEKKLIVEIGDEIIINNTTILSRLEKYINSTDNSDIIQAKQFYETMVSPDACEKYSILEADDLTVYVKLNEDYCRKIAEMRNTGMLINSRTKTYLSNYAAVASATGRELNELLRTTEPPRHDKWDAGLPYKESDKKRCASILKKIRENEYKTIEKIIKTDKSDSIDPDGIGNFLPDDFDTLPEISKRKPLEYSEESDVNTVKQTPVVLSSQSESAVPDTGKSDGGQPYDKSTGGTKAGKEKSGDKDDDAGDDIHRKGAGEKNIEIRIKYQRILPISTANGVYKVVLLPIENASNIYFRFNAVGDDSSEEALKVKRAIVGGISKIVDSDIVGPFDVVKDLRFTFEVVFDLKERILINTKAEVRTK